ncbi:MAG: DNA alkylation repair protein [Planctomycetota bacterium]
MNKTEALRELRSLGTAQNRKVYRRHGVTGESFGVSYANLGKLQRKIRTDHGLALGLWASGNHDARVLATMVADPEELKPKELDGWAQAVDCYPLGNAVASLVVRSPHASSCAKRWVRSKSEFVAATGWDVITSLAMDEPDGLADAELAELLGRIEKRIHAAANRTRYSMNGALIAIGTRSPKLERAAVAAAKRIGAVEVDHGETGCKTPDAASYIPKAAAHRRKKA